MLQLSDLTELTYASNLFGDWVDTLVCATDHHFVDHDLFSTQNNAIAADKSADSAAKRKTKWSMICQKWRSPCLLTKKSCRGLTLSSRQPFPRTRSRRCDPLGSKNCTRNQTAKTHSMSDFTTLSQLYYAVNFGLIMENIWETLSPPSFKSRASLLTFVPLIFFFNLICRLLKS